MASFGLAALPHEALAANPREQERLHLIQHIQDRVLGFDVTELLTRILREAKFPKRYVRELRTLLAGVETHEGLRSVQGLMENEELGRAARPILARARKDLRVKLRLLRMARRAPRSAEARQALLEHVYTDWFGLNMARIRAHVADTPATGDFAVIYGPVTDALELAGFVAREPIRLLLELVHGRRAVEVFCEAEPGSVRNILEVLLDPGYERVALIGHGNWGEFGLNGYYVHPDAAYAEIMDACSSEPAQTMKTLARGRVWGILDKRYVRQPQSLSEANLAQLVSQLHGDDPAAVHKDLIVRHTCGFKRYKSEASLLWYLVPEEVEAGLAHRTGGYLSADVPEHAGDYETGLSAFLTDTPVRVTARDAFGTCLVPSPEQTRGYEGDSWIDDFVSAPIPAYLPPTEFPQPRGESEGAAEQTSAPL